MTKLFKKYRQHDSRDCGAACLATIFSYYGANLSLAKCRELVKTDLQGSSIYGIVEGATSQGLTAEAYEGAPEELLEGLEKNEFHLPLIAHIITEEMMEHFVVILKIRNDKVILFDPGYGMKSYKFNDFFKLWTGHIITFNKNKNFKAVSNTKSSIVKLLSIMGTQRKLLLGILISSIIVMIISILGTFAYSIVIDGYLLNESNYSEANSVIETHNHEDGEICVDALIPDSFITNNISCFFVALIGLYILQAFIQFTRGFLLARSSKCYDLFFMNKYVDKIHRLPLSFFNNIRTGEIISRFSDIGEIRDAISGSALGLFFDFVIFISGAVVMWFLNHKLFFISMIIAIVYVCVIAVFKPFIEKINLEIMTENSKSLSDIKETVEGINTLRISNANQFSLEKNKISINSFANKLYKGHIIYSTQNSTNMLIESLGIVFALWLGSKLVINNQLSIGSLITFSMLISYIITPIKQIIELQPNVQKALVAFDRLNDILEAEDEFMCGEDLTEFDDIDIKNLSFRYGYRELTINNLSLKIKQGEKIALIGESGSGKTTLARILLKINQPERGIIRIGEKDLSEISCNSIRDNIVYVPQDAFIFNETIRNNILLGNKDITEEELIKVAKQTQLYDFISELPNGFETMLEENGKNLSGGQKQRIAIARALIKNPKILILDEATSQLDNVTELNIQNSLLNSFSNLTCIVIAHRLTTVKSCDKIALLENGSIAEYGSHEELLSEGGKYAEMWKYI